MEPSEEERTARDNAEMLRYFTDADTFRKENQKLDAVVIALRTEYDAKIETIRPALQGLMEHLQPFKVHNLHLLLPSTFRRLINLVATSLTSGMNFMRQALDAVVDHVQGKVGHFHHAMIVVGNVVDERLANFGHRIQGLHYRLRGVEGHVGLSPEQASARCSAAVPESASILARLTDVEAKLQQLKGDHILLSLRLAARHFPSSSGSRHMERSRERSPSPGSHTSQQSNASTYSRASSAQEAQEHLRRARAMGNTHGMITAAQALAFFHQQTPPPSSVAGT